MDKKINKKLSLNKDVVSRLNSKSMALIFGGGAEVSEPDPGSGDWSCDVYCSNAKDTDNKTCCKSKGSKKPE